MSERLITPLSIWLALVIVTLPAWGFGPELEQELQQAKPGLHSRIAKLRLTAEEEKSLAADLKTMRTTKLSRKELAISTTFAAATGLLVWKPTHSAGVKAVVDQTRDSLRKGGQSGGIIDCMMAFLFTGNPWPYTVDSAQLNRAIQASRATAMRHSSYWQTRIPLLLVPVVAAALIVPIYYFWSWARAESRVRSLIEVAEKRAELFASDVPSPRPSRNASPPAGRSGAARNSGVSVPPSRADLHFEDLPAR